MIYDPYSLFLTNEIRISEEGEALLSCPHPIHSHKGTNAAFNLNTGKYICFGKCGFKASNIIDLVNWLVNECGLVDAKIRKADASYINHVMIDEKISNIAKEYEFLPYAFDDPYLIKRGVTNDTVEYFQLRHSDNLICAPNYARNGKDLIGVNIRYTKTSGGGLRYRYIKANNQEKRAAFYPMHKLKDYNTEETLYITEGMFGVFNLYQHKKQAIALLGSGGLKDLNLLHGFEKIVICVDNDMAGKKFWDKFYTLNKKGYYFPIYLARPAEYDEVDKMQFEKLTNELAVGFSSSKGYFNF